MNTSNLSIGTNKLSIADSVKIQVLRGLAIIAVVCIHSLPYGIVQVFVRPFINFCVGLFLFLSGMLTNAGNYHTEKRLKKILIPYVIWTFIYTLFSSYEAPAQIPFVFLKSLITADSSSVMYYVFVYCELTLLVPLIDKLAKSRYRYLGFVTPPMEIIVMRLIPIILGIEHGECLKTILHISCLGWFSYYYLGYMLGNKLMEIKLSDTKLFVIWCISILLQFAEGYWYYKMNVLDCGVQLKLSAVLSGVFFCLLAYRFIYSEREYNAKLLKKLGDCSFGIFYSHIAVMMVLQKLPYYSTFAIFPINAIITLIVTIGCVYIGGILLGKYAKYFAL